MKKLQVSTTLSGIALAGSATVFALYAEGNYGLPAILHPPSVGFVVFVTLGVMLFSFSLSTNIDLVNFLLAYSPARVERQSILFDKNLSYLCEVYYNEGARGLEKKIKSFDSPVIWRKISDYLLWEISPEDLPALIRYEAQLIDEKLSQKLTNLRQMAQICPSVGVVGTVMGLMRLLGDLENTASLGSNMSLALVTTFYGLILSIAIFTPLAARLNEIKSINRRIFTQSLFWANVISERKPAFYCQKRTDRKLIR